MHTTVLGLSPASWLLLPLIGVVVGTFHTLGGVAGGVMLSILLAPVIGVDQVVPVVSVALLFGGFSRLYAFRHSIDWRVFRWIMVAAAPAIFAGALLFSLLSPRLISGTLGIFLLVTVLFRHTLRGSHFQVGRFGFSVLGGIFGFVSGMTVGGGMLLVPFLLGAGLTGERFVAIIGALGFTMSVIRVAAFGSLSVLNEQTVIIGIVVGLCVIPGTYLGHRIIKRTSIRLHTAFVEAIVVIGAAFFIWTALFPDGSPALY